MMSSGGTGGWAQGVVQRADGALAVGLVTTVRSAAVAIAAAALFCRRANASPL